jgi:hypothetical protein
MKIDSISQFNQEVDQYKLLSSTYGIGTIIPTKLGVFIMPLSFDTWSFMARAASVTSDNPEDLRKAAVTPVINLSFLRYLRESEGMTSLRHLIAIPHMQLDMYNKQEVEKNPMIKIYKEFHPEVRFFDSVFSVPAIIFPRWMYSPKDGRLQDYGVWKDEWKSSHNNQLSAFAPPKDSRSRTTHTSSRNGETYENYETLKQMQLVLVCPNGHISDIPWDKFFSASIDPTSKDKLFNEGFDLFGYSKTTCSCGGAHSLEFSENIGHTEGFGHIRCTKCNNTISLEGILNLRPKCSREMPWRRVSAEDGIPKDTVCRQDGKDGTMRVMLTTSPGIYYADMRSGLFVPDKLTEKERKGLDFINMESYMNYRSENPDGTKEDFWNSNGGDSSIKGILGFVGIKLSDNEFQNIKREFMKDSSESGDKGEEMKYEEYEFFTSNADINDDKLQIRAITMPKSLSEYFACIKKVPLLCIAKTQLNFFRVQSPVPTRNDRGGIDYPDGQKLSKYPLDKITAYPVIQEYGEGLFFQLNEEKLEEWDKLILENADERVQNRYVERDDDEKNDVLSVLNSKYRFSHRFYLIHTFAHSIIKELEFSCGYPSASLAERVYYSDRMCGVLIYTAEGSEGSMGGLVWQGQEGIIERIISRAMDRARHCSCDPICWEHEKESRNLAACFSCEMISETSCEFQNKGLDRQALVHDTFGYFKDLK